MSVRHHETYRAIEAERSQLAEAVVSANYEHSKDGTQVKVRIPIGGNES